MNPVLSEVWRGGLLESLHRGALCVMEGETVRLELGDVDRPLFPRSAVKPFQALPLLEEGVAEATGLSSAQLAIISGSHGGEPCHVAEVQELLDRNGIPRAALRCGVHAPFDRHAAQALQREGLEPTVLHNNCSGKHAGMLLLARHLGADLDGYLSPEHPVQQRIRRELAEFTDTPPEELTCAVDGCGAPAFSLPLRKLARAMARFAEPRRHEAARAAATRLLFDAVCDAPEFIAGRAFLDTHLIEAGQRRVLCKRGAEGVLALAIRGRPGGAGIGIALKIEDGAVRGYYPVAPWLLRQLGVPLSGLEDRLPDPMRGVLRNHAGTRIGELRLSDELRTLGARWTETA